MQVNLQLAVWNANGLVNHIREVEIFLSTYNIDAMLISETHFTTRSYFRIRGYDIINSNHPDGKAHGGAAIIIKSALKYTIEEEIVSPQLQATCVKVTCNSYNISLCAVYFPPRFTITQDEYHNFFNKLGPIFVVGGDFNAKHPWWGSRLTNPKGKLLHKCITSDHLAVLSTGSPTYWPSDPRKIPDLLDFVVYKGISRHMLSVAESFDLSSDHSPILVTVNTLPETTKTQRLVTLKTDIGYFHQYMDARIHSDMPIKNGFDLDTAIESFTQLIYEAAYQATPFNQSHAQHKTFPPSQIRDMIRQKRKLRKIWQTRRLPNDKRKFNQASKELKQALSDYKNKTVLEFLKNLNINKNNEHCLWKTTKYLKRPTKRNVPIRNADGSWCKTDIGKAHAFSEYLKETFQPLLLNSYLDNEEVMGFLDIACQMDLPIKRISHLEVEEEIIKLNNSKTPGYDGIDAKTIKSLSEKCIQYLTMLFNQILRLDHFPTQWKCAEIIMIPKPNKPENDIKSYRPISLLATFSKIFERIFLRRMLLVIERDNIIPEHQFGFRNKHGTIEQCHRVVSIITDALENKKYCSGVFLDIQQAFDRVWHPGLLYKLKKHFPLPFYLMLKSYLSDRCFYVKHRNERSEIHSIEAGVPQGSVLGPVLYTIFTSDFPTTDEVMIATFADDTALLSLGETPTSATLHIQPELTKIETWMKKWNVKVNTDKSVHVTFTTRRENCPQVYINATPIPQKNSVRYLGMHLDRRLTWKDHIKAKRQQLKIKTNKMYWLLGAKSELSLENKIRLYKAILKPIWTYGIQLWGTAANSNIEILQRYQSKTLRMILNAPWFITNESIHSDLEIPYVKEGVRRLSNRYLNFKLSDHSNTLAICLLDDSEETKRLKRFHVLDLPFRN